MAGIQNLSRGVLRRLEDSDNPDEELCKAVDAIGAEAARAGEIIDRVRSYSKGKNERRNISLNNPRLKARGFLTRCRLSRNRQGF